MSQHSVLRGLSRRKDMDGKQRHVAIIQPMAHLQAGHSWQTAAANAGLQISQSNAYRLLKAFRQRGEALPRHSSAAVSLARRADDHPDGLDSLHPDGFPIFGRLCVARGGAGRLRYVGRCA